MCICHIIIHTCLPHAFKRCHIIMCICHIISSHTCLPHAFGCATRTEECGRFVTEKSANIEKIIHTHTRTHTHTHTNTTHDGAPARVAFCVCVCKTKTWSSTRTERWGRFVTGMYVCMCHMYVSHHHMQKRPGAQRAQRDGAGTSSACNELAIHTMSHHHTYYVTSSDLELNAHREMGPVRDRKPLPVDNTY
jgi:hypothetical protein